MPLNTGSHSLRARKTKKDGRKRASSTVSNNTTSTQAGPVDAQKNAGNEQSPKTQPNESKQDLNPQTAESSPDKPDEHAEKALNVFQFLDENDDSSSTSTSDSSEDEDELPSTRTQPAPEIQSPKPRTSPVPHALLASKTSPSQKSTKASSTATSRNPSASRPSPALPAPASSENQSQIARQQSQLQKYGASQGESPSRRRSLHLSRPENYYALRDASSVNRPPLPPSPPSSPEDSIHRGTPARRRNSKVSHVPSGYGLIASYLTRSAGQEKDSFPPLYRRFERVNHRVLLHLQDEISQMEEDLHALDEYEEMHRIATAEQEGTKPMPASRRLEVQSQAYSSLHYQRMEVMAALVQKTEQYNNALSAYSKVLQTLPRASEDDIQNYRAWMKTHNPIAASETRFLDYDADLVSLTPRLAASAASAPAYTAIIIASGALLLPLLAFSMIAEFSGRLVVVTVVGGAAAAIAANYSAGIETLVDSRDGWRCAMLYFGFMTVAAMFIP